MNETGARPPPERAHAGHESTDVSPASVGTFALGLVVMIAIVLPLLGWVMARLEKAAEKSDPVPSPVASDQTPPAPRLENDPAADLARLRREEDDKLSSYGWIDREQGVVRIPVDRAIEILAERGLPEPKGPLQPARKEERTP